MANLLKISGGAPALLLLAALLAAGARADDVTTDECKPRGGLGRVRQYPVDSDATKLDISTCSLTSIEQRTITGLPALTTLLLNSNKLRELPVFDEHVCANLTLLSLWNNQLTEINNAGTFSACTKLETLWLNINQIEFIHHSVFTALTNLNYLGLSDNKIRYIPDQMFSNNGKLVWLHLRGNRITHLPPEFASRLKRAALSLDTFLFDNNPWHCACLIELLADVRRAGVRCYTIKFYDQAHDGSAPVCVFTGAAPCCRRAPAGLLPARGGGLRGGGLRGGGLRGGGLRGGGLRGGGLA